MTGYAITAKSEALELHELPFEELDAVAGGDLNIGVGVCTKSSQESQKQDPLADMFKALMQQG
ncbi:hypothetical protein [Bradyrhizobium sp. Tv2a-2]|uniref:hypothetical protein n=1 Tax=Bradyrhizobium sp. Tv2a-2 TaxID=113395 RepID=UPI0004631B3F|nr:hypothetical protein [Bradyrhizobium sp. Tv2a-2]